MTLTEFRARMVDPFADDDQRLRLFLHLEDWVSKLRALNVGAILWLDGSFVTEKVGPGDIDCVMWNPTFVGAVSIEDKERVLGLIDRDAARSIFGLDLYIELPQAEQSLHKNAYWRGLFGFQHSGTTAKGFVELSL